MAARFKLWVCGRTIPGIAGLNPTGGMNVTCECCVLSGRGLCDGPITRPECGVCDCYPETSTVRNPRSTRSVEPRKKKKKLRKEKRHKN